MHVSLQYLQRCSSQTGYPVPPLEKVVRLGEMAGDVARHPFLGSVLALKGGTALNLCFGPPKRLSVDLDYNYIGHADREKMLADRPRVEQLAPMLAVDAPPRADDLVKQAWEVLSEFMTLRPNEAAYIASIERGELRPELLFTDDPEAAQRIVAHPAILWKVTNVRAHLARRLRVE